MARARPPRFACCSASSGRPRVTPPSWTHASRQARAPFSRAVGYLVETATAYPNLTVRENLDIQRRLTGAPRTAVGEAMALLGLSKSAERRAGQLSLGNKQRLSLARALLHRPELLILDEPANGLDPAGIIEIRELLRRLVDENGVTIFMSSHILAEVAHLADRIGIVHGGQLLEELDYAELRSRTRQHLDVGVSDPDGAAALLRGRLGINAIERTPEGALRLFDGLARSAEIAVSWWKPVSTSHPLSRRTRISSHISSGSLQVSRSPAVSRSPEASGKCWVR